MDRDTPASDLRDALASILTRLQRIEFAVASLHLNNNSMQALSERRALSLQYYKEMYELEHGVQSSCETPNDGNFDEIG